MEKTLLSVKEVVELTGKSPNAIYVAIRKGQLTVTRSTKPMLIDRRAALEWSSPKTPPVSEEDLRRLYHDERLSLGAIGDMFGVYPTGVQRWMDYYGIPRRTLSEARMGNTIRKDMSPRALERWSKRQREAQRGKKHSVSEEERKRRSERAKRHNRRLWSNGVFGSAEWQKKQHQTHAGEKNWRWKGGTVTYRGPNWIKQRRKARKRDNYTCQRCGATQEELGRNLDVHHIIPYREFTSYEEANQLDNLTCYCKSCHASIEMTEYR